MNVQQLFGMAASALGGQLSTGNAEADRYVRYVSKMVEQILTRWTSVGASGVKCHVAQHSEDGEKKCKSVAIGGCMACGSPVCIDHAFVSLRGVVCFVCADEVIGKHNPDAKTDRGRPFGFVDPYENESSEDTRQRHLRTLGLVETADEEAIKAAYRHLAKRYHPDRSPESERESCSKKLRGINEAYEWLTKKRSRAA
jgi:hypothetical protein